MDNTGCICIYGRKVIGRGALGNAGVKELGISSNVIRSERAELCNLQQGIWNTGAAAHTAGTGTELAVRITH